MVGIAGGVPAPHHAEDHVRLGDIVVSNEKGIIQYDFVKRTDTFEERRHSPKAPSAELLETIVALHSTELEGERPWETYIAAAVGSLGWVRPNFSTDVLHSPGGRKVIPHPEDPDRTIDQPKIFRGPIASSNTLLKSPALRDLLRDEYGVKAVEMEGAGIADAAWIHDRGYLVVRGICDYCDKSKGNEWQNYASIAAAAYARSILEHLPAAKAGVVVSHDNGTQHDVERLRDLVHEMDSRRVFYAVEEDLDYALKSVLDARKAMRKIARGLWLDSQAEGFAADLQRVLSDFITGVEAVKHTANSYDLFYDRLLGMRKTVGKIVSQIIGKYGQRIRVRNLALGERH